MPRGGVATIGPRGGTDGSDFAYRMTVEDRYKRAALARMRLRKFLTIQAAFELFKAVWAALMSLNGELADITAVVACTFGGCAVFIGTLGLKTGASSHLLKLYMLLTGTSLSLSLLPMLTGQSFTKWSEEWQSKSTEDTNKLVLISLEALQEIVGVLVQLMSVFTALSLSNNIAVKKSS